MQPYKYWSRDLLHEFLIKQCIDYGIDSFMVKEMCYSEKWNPKFEYNGCTFVQDELHPFLPCFIHDYRWIVGEGGLDSNLEFKTNLIKAGFSKSKALKYFLGVHLGWILYYKWKHLLKDGKKN